MDFVQQAGASPFVPDVGDHTHTHSPRTQSTRQYKPCPLETAAARVEGARYCCVLAAAVPVAFANHTKQQQHAKPVGLVLPRVCFSYSCRNSFELMTAESFSRFCSCNFSHQLKSLTIPEAIRHPTRETQEHRVTSTHSAAAPSACGSFKCGGSYCPMCDFLGRMVLLRKRLRSNFCAAAWCGSRR